MIKISALNEESSEESEEEDVPTITKEAQEQIALTEYNKALELLKENKQEDALNIFKDLLETELLDEVEKPEIPDGRSRPMLSLKYSCFKNIGAIQATLENYDAAIENYWEAANLDGTDVTLWYRIGMLAMKISNLELACSSFKQGLKCNSNHWPCLDNMITALYAVPDYMNCLLYISMALERDPNYVKGLAFREKIFKDIPCLEECYKLYNSDWQLDPPLYTEYDRVIGEKLIREAQEVAGKWVEACKAEFTAKPLPELTLRKPIKSYTWVDLGECLLDMHKYITENDLSFVSRINLAVQNFEESPKSNAEGDIQENNNVNTDTEVSQSAVVKKENDVDKLIRMDIDEANSPFEISDDNQVYGGTDTMMDIDPEDDKKSSSSDVQIIEDDDPLRISDTDAAEEQNQLKNDLEEQGNFEEDENGDKMMDDAYNSENRIQNDNASDKDSNKSNDKEYEKDSKKTDKDQCKGDEKSNDKIEEKDKVQKVKKRRRSALCFLQQWAWSCNSMRRSARVRSSNRREAERDDVQLEETLRRIFPSTLLPDTVKLTKDDPSKNMDDSMDTMELYQLFANQENNSNIAETFKSSDSSKSPSPDTSRQQHYFGTESEAADVNLFINQHSGKSNLMIIIARYTEFLCTKWNQEWPKGMSDVYLQAYTFMREHIPHPSSFEEDIDDDVLKLDTEMTLLFGELHTDRWLNNKPDILPSSTLDKLGTGLPSEELGHIIFTSVRRDILNEENMFILLRVLWLKANVFLCQGDTDIVIDSLELLSKHMKELEKQNQNVYLKLPNCKHNCQISIKIVEKKLKSIQRGQKLGEIQHLYDEKKYAELAYVLQDTFKFAKQGNKLLSVNDNIVDRVQQLSMLLDSLWQLQQYEECYVWAEACLNESWQNYLNTADEAEQKKWTSSVLMALEKLESCTIEVSTFVVKYLPETRLSRLVQNLVHIVCHQLDVSETTVEMPLETVLPWILLHYVLQYKEDKERAKAESSYKNKHSSNYSESDDEDEGVPASITILFIAHNFIGRHSWCCYNEAKLLFFTLSLVIPKLEAPQFSSIKGKVSKYLEQIFYCLYGHCNKVNKGRPKHIEDHGVPQMKMTWEGAQLLFDFYKPKQIPEFYSPRSLTISADTEELFKRIIKLIPPESNPNQVIDEMMAYIMGERKTMVTVKKPLPHSMSTIYYLLGDFYFKNCKWSAAIRYYLLDLCFHPSRLSSWTGLAMSSGTVIETWLNRYKPINEDKLLAKAKMTQSSYQHAVELDSCNHIIWTEYGTFAYVVHSFCSRLLKQETDTLSMERFEVLETRKEEMLEIAHLCFQSCAHLFIGDKDGVIPHDERWLYQYMLGKIAEKKNQDPPIFLEHYAKASELLYHNHAQYPRRISHKGPQHLSVEALEVHYRIHASVLKYLEQHEGKPLKKSLGQVLQLHLEKSAQGPFMEHNSKVNEKSKEDNLFGSNKGSGKEMEVSGETERNVVAISQRSNSIEEIEIVDGTTKGFSHRVEQMKTETRKRSPSELPQDDVKKIKLGNVSHLQLMQDVVALIDDVITKVCDMVLQKEKSDDIMVLSSDESNESKSQKKKAKRNVEKTKSRAKSDESKKSSMKMNNVFETEKSENVQDLMDALMKQAMEISQETRQSTPEDEDTRKFDGKWLQSEDLQLTSKDSKEKPSDKKKLLKEEMTISRRGSQESTTTTQTTTTTETNNSSSSSSDESSSSDDSSDSDSSSDTDSDSVESDNEKKKKETNFAQKEETMTEEEVATLIAYCLAGLEQCILRFSEHYKSFYRLSHFFFNNKTAKDITKCRNLLLDTYNCQFYRGENFQGLFSDRKSTNFFSGVWHIPNREVDRPGSFAFHMSRCVTLLMQVLKETNDGRMLMQLSVQLGKIPESDKKYLRDSEREQLSCQALTLCLQSLRTKVQLMGASTSDAPSNKNTDARTQVLLDTYWVYQRALKSYHTKEQTIQTLASLLVDTYKTYIGNKNLEGNVLEIATKYCNDYNCNRKLLNKFFCNLDKPLPDTQPQPQATSPVPVIASQPQVTSTSPQSSQNRKPYRSGLTTTGRPRGRPPNVNKYLPTMQHGNPMNQFNPKANFPNYMGASGNRSLMNPYFMHPLVDPNILSALLSTGLSSSMMDPLSAMNYLNQMGNYQDIFRQYTNNLSSLSNLTSGLSSAIATAPNISNVSTMSTSTSNMNAAPNMSLNNLNNLTVQQLLSLSNSTATTVRSSPMYQQAATAITTTTASITKDRPSISITPVNTAPAKSKPSKQSPQSEPLPVQLPKSLQISPPSKPVLQPPTTQVSLLKPSILQHVKTSPPKQMSAPQIRVSKSLTEPQPAHNPSLSHSPLKSNTGTNPTTVPQVAHSTMGPSMTMKQTLPMNVPSSGTSLQHKLLSKKNSQRSYAQASVQNPARKTKPKTMPALSGNFSNMLNAIPGNSSMPQPPYIPPELSGISVSAVNPQTGLKGPAAKYSGYKKPSVKTKPTLSTDTASLPTAYSQGNSAEALSMLSQLKQHSHLEIIPQQKTHMKPSMEYTKSLSSGVTVVPQKVSETLRSNTDCMTIYDLPRVKSSSVTGKKGEKGANDSVEIITLDD
uniref:calcineurin-binding protein cabin-1-like isoform X1 n=1 Tax=Osmia lignaria TaxID=473952 RepID=UPI001478A48E|nr:calcineurin-binding protein cabin-1-like isoform X1 [Osmia lignaria]XP_034185242.1 calcineurin-binding protein cabin-1-like isoform X1 [Osmia lignaria]XP_034185243.1 calcineurin-binding protein cabin-1-like isoform X1 [Osmia lignaria]